MNNDNNNKKPCQCLLREAGENELADKVKEFINGLSEEAKSEEALYRQRLSLCKSCKHLLNGTCMKCGCYVEMRAAIKTNHCPSEEKFW